MQMFRDFWTAITGLFGKKGLNGACWKELPKYLTRKPKVVALCAVIMLIPAILGVIATRINYDILSYLPEDLESSQGEKLLEEPFKMAATSMLVVENMPAGYTNSLINAIKDVPGVSNAIWISNLMGIQIPTDMIPANFRDMFFSGGRHHDDHSVQPSRRLGRDHGGH